MLHVLLASAPLTIEMSVAADVGGSRRWLDDCCRPIRMILARMQYARNAFVSELVSELEASQPSLVQQMVAAAAGWESRLTLLHDLAWCLLGTSYAVPGNMLACACTCFF